MKPSKPLSPLSVLRQKSSLALSLLACFALVRLGYLAANSKQVPPPAGAGSLLRSAETRNEDGWKPIHVFYGTREHLERVTKLANKDDFRDRKFFSQVKQDETVLNLFNKKRGGYFVDLAAHDAVDISNSYALETHHGWEGVCIEPNAAHWPSLSYRKCHVVGAVAGGDREEVYFNFVGRHPGGASGGIIGDEYDNKDKSKGQPRMTVPLDEILRRFDAPKDVDYFSLDVEGAEGLILTQSVLSAYTFKVLTIERPKKQLEELLALNGYTNIRKLSGFDETLWVHQSAVAELNLTETERRLVTTQSQSV